MVSLRTISVLALMVVASEAYHVLLVYTMPGKSLSLHGEAFVQHLLKAGHEVSSYSLCKELLCRLYAV